MKSRFILSLAILMAATAAGAETLSNDAVVGLASVGLGDDVIIAKIKASEAGFDVSASALSALKAKGVSNAVITAMVERSTVVSANEQSLDSPDPMINHPMGVYLLDETGTPARMVKIDSAASSQMKVGNTIGYAFSGGLAPITMKVSIQGTQAHVISASRQPVFFMFAAQSQKGGTPFNPYAMMANASFMTLSSPNEFSLVRLVSKSGHREAKVGNYSVTGMQTGVMDKDRVQFAYSQVRDGVYRLTVSGPIEPGEYAFVKGVVAGSGVFDFSVR